MRSLFPSAEDYRMLRSTWRSDVMAGVTVGIVALPLALGFGVSSGLSPSAGLITAIVAGFLAAVFGGSGVQVSGPTGAMAVVLLPIVAAHGATAVALISVGAGAILIVAGALRLGRAVSYIPWPVIEGFTLGIACIIFLQQVPALTGPAGPSGGGRSTNALIAAGQSIAAADLTYLAWAVGSAVTVAACMLGAKTLHPAIPGSLVGIVLVTVACALLPTPLAAIGQLPGSLPRPQLPQLPPEALTHLILPTLTVAALAAIESLLSARVAASMADTGPYDADRELVGQGIASLGSGFFGGMPATGAIARTAVSVRAGGITRLASITHAVVLLLVVVAIAAPVGMIPLAGLSGVLMMTAVQMVNRQAARTILRSTRADATAFILTAVVTVSVDLIVAVLIGMAAAGFFALRAVADAAGIQREPLPRSAQGEKPDDDQIAIIRFTGSLIFASAERVFGEVTRMRDVKVVILRLSGVDHVDATGAHILVEIVQALERRGVTVLLKGVQSRHDELFGTTGVLTSLRHDKHLFTDLDEAVAHARDHVSRDRGDSVHE